MADALRHLTQPIDLGPFTLPHRIVVTAHTTAFSTNGLVGADEIAYQARKARGGYALLTTGSTAVHPSGGAPQMRLLTNFSDEVLPGYEALAAAVHGHGARMLVQLTHLASTFASHHTHATWAPSQVVGEYAREVPHVMSTSEVGTVVDCFFAAATRVRRGNLDGVELQAFSGSLAVQFLSPFTNKRTDEYGGDLDNRLRFTCEMIDACRSALGSDRLLGLKIAGDELVQGGLRLSDVVEIVRRIDAIGKVDYYVVAAGNNLDRFARVDHWPPTPAAHNLYAHLARGVRETVSRPVAALGRIVDPWEADRLIADGYCDLVAMARASIADEEMPNKLMTGRLGEVRICVGDNTACVDRIIDGQPMRCIYNPVIGRERALDSFPASRRASSLNVVVVGGGPAGMEAARVAAEMGCRVDLYERGGELGGTARIVAMQPGRSELAGITAWLERQVVRLGVDVHLNEDVSALQLRDDFDAVIIATGARTLPANPIWQKDFAGEVASAREVLEGLRPRRGRVVVEDHSGSQVGCAAAELLSQGGYEVEVVTRHFYPAIDFGLTNTVTLFRRLFCRGIQLTPHHQVASASGFTVTLTNVYSGAEEVRENMAAVVLATGSVPIDELYRELVAEGRRVLRAGDCVAPRDIESAVYEGHIAARSVRDSQAKTART